MKCWKKAFVSVAKKRGTHRFGLSRDPYAGIAKRRMKLWYHI